ncbi:hypothetical protein APUTEX25_004355 [Auxenochlorella protothecoides]|uniref:Cytochrome P450 n=1 Tax=Auxenochlorella protothecoides TaxID=3075 RepID=A0A3M7KZM3_AUXPR|nr:hypothetical protein APUTEX25_004355 [Auxenochlorella protothecoides]|eukprot:RMZ55931.1 hypothetical protein APUTEX25_004355 [Auxenochlorella protothecoides]
MSTYDVGAANLRKVLQGEDQLVRSQWPPATAALLGRHSLSNLAGPDHARLRRMMLPAFTPRAVQGYYPFISSATSAALEAWCGSADPVLAYKAVNSLALKIAIGVIAGTGGPWMQAEAFPAFQRLVTTWLEGLFAWRIDLSWTRFGKARKARAALDQMVLESIEASRSGTEFCAIRVMLDARDEGGVPCSTLELLDNVMTLLFAGHDTSATAMLCLLEEMRKHPEGAAVIAEHGEELTPTALAAMPLAEGWVKESMRRTPVVPIVPRTAIQGFEVGGFWVRPGQPVVAGLRSTMQLDPRFEGSKPLAFCPERWMAPEASRDAAWMPFGGGPRLCLGNLLSMAELKIFLALLTRRYDVEFLDHAEAWHYIPLARPLRGMPIRLRPRHLTGKAPSA